MRAAQHAQQDTRLETLASYHVLDTEAEADFDDIVALASKICDAPISLISLVDKDRQWFKARHGFDEPETTLDKSVCSHAILEEGVFEITDMAADTRTADNPLHTAPDGVKFYAGANLIAPNGMPLGTLCVLDTEPRALTDFQKQALATLSRQVMMQMELRKKIRAEENLRAEMDHRVKNSLQTIASMTRLAARDVKDEAALDMLELVNRRIEAVASLHSELMGNDGDTTIDITSYFERLRSFITAVTPENIAIHFDAQGDTLQAHMASAIGMIVSEFVANSVKHAFPDGRTGQVAISLRNDGAGLRVLECSDNGVGLEAQDRASAEPAGLGKMLMQSAALQLDGDVQFEVGSGGARMTVQFAA
ncbi:MAG: histidine kinase dimerization/phosphoacceptor domain -containing protein [Pseudomonadota bacterium]